MLVPWRVDPGSYRFSGENSHPVSPATASHSGRPRRWLHGALLGADARQRGKKQASDGRWYPRYLEFAFGVEA